VESLYAAYEGKFAQQELLGEFVGFDGLVYDEFDRGRNVKTVPSRTWTRVFAGVDEGYTNPAVILIVGEDHDGRLHVMHEFYQRRRLQAVTAFPSTAPTAAATQTQKKVMMYHLPDGWKTVSDTSGTFEVGYDPSQNTTEQRDQEIVLGKIGPTTGVIHIVSLRPYDGGSRHNFIYKQMNAPDPMQDRMPGYYESEFRYNGWSCLVLHGFSYSASGDIHGMCAVDSTRAFMFFGIPSEDVVRTVRLLK
jgi:hypothetical protein